MKKILLQLLLALGFPMMLSAQTDDHNFDVAKNLDVLNAIYKQLDMMYVDTLDANEVIGTGVGAVIGACAHQCQIPQFLLWIHTLSTILRRN